MTPLRLARPALLVSVMLLASLSPILIHSEQKEEAIDDQFNESEFEKYRFSIDENRIFDLRPSDVYHLDEQIEKRDEICLLYTSPSPRDA